MTTDTSVESVSYNREEYITVLDKVIVALDEYRIARDNEIDEYLNNNEYHKNAFTRLQNEYYEYCKKYIKIDSYSERFLRRAMFNCHFVVEKTVEKKDDTITFVTVDVPVPQTFFDVLFNRPIQYYKTTEKVVVKGEEIVTYESLEDFWIRLDESLNTPEFDRIGDRMMFYHQSNNIIRNWYGEDYHRKTRNKIPDMIISTKNDLDRVKTSPDASYTIDSKTFKMYSDILTGKFKTPYY